MKTRFLAAAAVFAAAFATTFAVVSINDHRTRAAKPAALAHGDCAAMSSCPMSAQTVASTACCATEAAVAVAAKVADECCPAGETTAAVNPTVAAPEKQ